MELEPRMAAPAHTTGVVAFVPLSEISDDTTFQLRQPADVAALAASIGRLGHLVPVELRPLRGDPVRFQVVAGFRRLAALRLLARERVLARVHESLDDADAWGIALAQALLCEPLRGPELEELGRRLATERIAPWAEELIEEALVRAPVEPEVRERFLAFLRGADEKSGGMPEPASEGGAEGADATAAETAAAGEESSAAEGAHASPDEAGEGVEPSAAEAAEPPRPDEPVEMTPGELADDLARRLSETNQDLAVAFEVWGEIPEDRRRIIREQARYVAELYPFLARGRR